MAAPLLFLISAPSGAGKTTLCEGMLASTPGLVRAITCTTRWPRAGERPDIDYYFLAAEDFARRVEAGLFLEHATVFGHQYGTLRSEVTHRLAAGQDVLLAIDVQGAAAVRREAQGDPVLQRSLVTVFIAPPSLAALEQRLRGRAKDSEETIRRRLATAHSECARWAEFDYLVVSDTIPEDLRRVKAIWEAEKLRTLRNRPPDAG